MTKKTILVLIIIVASASIGAWFYFNKSTPQFAPDTLSNVLPFGSGDGYDGPTSIGPNTNFNGSTSTDGRTVHLFKLSDTPVAGGVAFSKGGNLIVRYAERATGHIVDIDPISLTKVKIANTTIPKVYNALWKPSGNTVIFQTISGGDTIESISYELIPPTGTSTADTYTTKSTGLPANISEIAGGQNNIFYTVKSLPQVVTSLFDGSKASTVWSSQFSQWVLSPINDTQIILTTKASMAAAGYSYSLNTRTGLQTKLLGPFNGLSALPNTKLTRIAYSYVTNGSFVLVGKNLSSGEESSLYPATLAEKCVWSSKNENIIYCGVPTEALGSNEPDSWYKGVNHYSDRLWRFNIATGFAESMVDPRKSFGISIDAEKLFLSPDEDYLFFTNRNDLTLWALKLVD